VIVDLHCHCVFTARPAVEQPRFSFEPVRQAEGEPAWDAAVSPRASRWWTSRVLQRMLGLDWRLDRGRELDAALERVYERHLHGPGPIERFVLLAFDWYHDDSGAAPPLARDAQERASDLYTSNTLVASVCRRRPDRFLFGASVHPYRRDAIECVEEVSAAGACLLKWLPLHQNIDVMDPRAVDVLRKCAELDLPVLVHYGPEFSLATNHPEFESVTPLLDVLRRLRRENRLPTVIVAHVATPVLPWGIRRSFDVMIEALLGEFAAAPLYADLAAITAYGKVRFMKELARRPELHPKLLFGSDFPIPIAWPRVRGGLGRDGPRIRANGSWPQQMVQVLRRYGFNEIVFHRGAELLSVPAPAAASPV
jgi:hypothetical protein